MLIISDKFLFFKMKRLFFTIFFGLCVTVAFAQRLGGVASYQLTQSFQTTSDNLVDFNAKPGSGFAVGVWFDWDITRRWGLEVGATYNLRSANYDLHYQSDTSTIFKRQVYFLNIPVHAYVNFPFKKWTLALYFGPSFNVGLHGKDIAWENTEIQKPVMLETENIFGEDGRLQRFEIGAEIGLNAKYRNFIWSIGYHQGFNNLVKNDYNWTFDLPTGTKKYVAMGEVKISFGYLFNLGK